VSTLLTLPIESGLITVDEFEAMDLPEFCEWELVDGTVVSVTSPDLDHIDLQDQIAVKLKQMFQRSAVIRVEYPYALGAQNRFRADVAVVDPARHRQNRKHLEGAPELVIEVMSRSNTDRKIQMLQERCFAQGCQSFWRIYPKKSTVIVGRAAGSDAPEKEYGMTGTIALDLFGIRGEIAVMDLLTLPD
jgi:Uma2 family endonuclease